ncbi:MAG: arylsulfatase [Lentisphaerae bacterium]|nr:arylsulfatase [Lentisphaerota bacterium]
MGYGDMACNNPDSKIPTPNLDRLAEEGMRFTDAHAASSICTPSRYNLLTGRYAWRTRLKRGIVWEWDSTLIEPTRLTVAGLLKQSGYATHCIGKWHLGWDWTMVDGKLAGPQLPFGQHSREIQQQRVDMGYRIDYGHRIAGGPVDHGFDTYYGVDVPNFPPYTWFENAQVTAVPSVVKPDSMYGNPGLMIPDWSLKAVVPQLTRRAVTLIETASEPFFLYFPLTSPHAPIVPNKPFRGMSKAGKYGDFVCEVDWVVGEVMRALARCGKADNTLLIFTSDNGPEAYPCDYEGAYELARTTGHYSMGHLRGTKRDIWEGGHRVPFIARFPGITPAGTVCHQLVCLGDFMASCADIIGVPLPSGTGEDSVSMLSLLQGRPDQPTRTHLVYHSGSGHFAIRSKDWVLINAPGGGDMKEPDWFRRERGYTTHDHPGELFCLREDCSEKENLYGDYPEVVQELSGLLAQVKQVPGAGQPAVAGSHESE